MWTTVYIAMGKGKANNIEKLTRDEGFFVKVRYYGKEGNMEMYEIITLESEAEEFYEFLLENNIL